MLNGLRNCLGKLIIFLNDRELQNVLTDKDKAKKTMEEILSDTSKSLDLL